MRHATKQRKNYCQEINQSIKSYSELFHVLALSDSNFTITAINMLTDLPEKMNYIQYKIGIFSSVIETVKQESNRNVIHFKSTVSEMKNSFDMLINILAIAMEKNH